MKRLSPPAGRSSLLAVAFAAIAFAIGMGRTADAQPIVRPLGAEPTDEPAEESPSGEGDEAADGDEPVPEWHTLQQPSIYVEDYPAFRGERGVGNAPGENAKMLGFSEDFLFLERGSRSYFVPWEQIMGAKDNQNLWMIDLRNATYEDWLAEVRTPKTSSKYGFTSHERMMQVRRERGLDRPAGQAVAAAPAPPRPAMPAPPVAEAEPPLPVAAPPQPAGMNWKVIAILAGVVLFVLFLILK